MTASECTDNLRTAGAAARARALFCEVFGATRVPCVEASAPGRVELCGNHTDHQGGKVISSAMDRRMAAVAAPNDSSDIRIVMEGFGTFELDLDDPDVAGPLPDEFNTSAGIIRGMLASYPRYGEGEPFGFDAAIASDIPAGAGLSSSAAFEVLMANLYCGLFGAGEAPDPLTVALVGCDVERTWFGKPAGAQDQMACSIGGAIFMDFSTDPPTAVPAPFDAVGASCDLVLIDSGGNHSEYPNDFAAIPGDMADVAAAFGAARLGDVSPADFYASVPQLRAELGDRAVLRAFHYYDETVRVQAQYDALSSGDAARFLALARLAGMSSAEVLQNATPALCLAGPEQPVAVILALCAHELGVEGAWRIHGGGFGGSVLAFVPHAMTDGFIDDVCAILGPGSCMRLSAGCTGASFTRLQ